jgi:predicted transcriptional regulator
MEHVSLSYPNLKTYIKLMLRLRLLETCKTEKSNGRGRVFQATEKGLAFFKTYCNLLRIIYGEDLLQKANNLAVACLNYCKETE